MVDWRCGWGGGLDRVMGGVIGVEFDFQRCWFLLFLFLFCVCVCVGGVGGGMRLECNSNNKYMYNRINVYQWKKKPYASLTIMGNNT